MSDTGPIKMRALRTAPSIGLLFALALAAAYATTCAITLAHAAQSPPAAGGGQVVALVNGDPITALDVVHRMRLSELMSHKVQSKPDALEEMINEKIKLQQAKNAKIDITDAQVDKVVGGMAQRMSRKSADFLAALAQAGIDIPRFKLRLRAELGWRQVLEQRAPGIFQVRDADLVAILMARGEAAQTKAVQYSLQQIVLVVPRNSPEPVRTGRMKEAENLRNRFSSCEQDMALAREIREVVVKEPIVRLSTDLGVQYKQLLDKTPDGKMTPPEVIATGIELVAICSRKEVVADVSSRREFKEELLTKRLAEYEKYLLDYFRKQSTIEYR
jgi:peptidyl-prolyl cis-trans isomerase SurA